MSASELKFEQAPSLHDATEIVILAIEYLEARDGEYDLYHSMIMLAVLERLIQHAQRRHALDGNENAVKAAKRVLGPSKRVLRDFWRALEQLHARAEGEKLVADVLHNLWPASVAS